MYLITMCITFALGYFIMSKLVLESIKHHNTELKELKRLHKVTMRSSYIFGIFSFVGYHLLVHASKIRIKNLLKSSCSFEMGSHVECSFLKNQNNMTGNIRQFISIKSKYKNFLTSILLIRQI